MAELITKPMRIAIKKMVEVSQCVRALSLMPTPQDFAMRLIGDMKIIAKRVNTISNRINDILDRYSSIPGEFLLKGFDEILERLDNVNDYTKFAIKETSDVLSTSVKNTREITEAIGSATSTLTSATLQIGGGLAYGTTAMGANLKLAMTGNGGRRIAEEVARDVAEGKVPVSEMDAEIERRINEAGGNIEDAADSIRDWTVNAATNSTQSIDGFFDKAGSGIDNAVEWIGGVEDKANELVDDSIGVLIEKVEKAKREIEEKIQKVRDSFNKFAKDFDEAFGFINGKNFAEDAVRNISNTAYEMNSPTYDALGEVTEEVADFIKNFNIAKVVTSIGGIVIGAGAATLAMDLLPSVDVDKMLKSVIGGVDIRRVDKMAQLQYNKYYESEPDLLDVPDVSWRLSKDDLEKYNADGYNKYLEEFSEQNDITRSEIFQKMQNVKKVSDLIAVTKENKELMKENKSALKAMRKVRRDAIKAKQIEKYKGFLSIELNYLKKECLDMKNNIKNEWDAMMAQYKAALAEIKKFFTTDGSGGNETVDRCCDRINDDATQIVELCQSLAIELTSTVSKVPTPYALGLCFDMPVHKILSFFMDLKLIITFLKNLIRLGLDIISQITILVKLIFNGLQSLADLLKTLKDLIGVDKILNMIDFLVGLFRPKLVESKILLENCLSPIYYKETDDYERRVTAIESILESDQEINRRNKAWVEGFYNTDDPYARKKSYFGGTTKDEEEVENWLEALEEKGDNEIVAYRSPILNDAGDDFAGWIYYHPHAYGWMKSSWRKAKKRRRNKLIKNASKKNKMVGGRLIGGVAQLKKNTSFGKYVNGRYIARSVTGYDAYYWYTEFTNDPMDCEPDFDNLEIVYDAEGNIVSKTAKQSTVVSPVLTTANGSMVELNDGRRVFVEGEIVKSGDFVNVNGVKYRVK